MGKKTPSDHTSLSDGSPCAFIVGCPVILFICQLLGLAKYVFFLWLPEIAVELYQQVFFFAKVLLYIDLSWWMNSAEIGVKQLPRLKTEHLSNILKIIDSDGRFAFLDSVNG